MSTMQTPRYEAFDERSTRRAILDGVLYAMAALLLVALAWFVYTQMNAVRGVKVEAPSPQMVSMLPPPPPPPPPPEVKEKPPEPTERPQPSPVEAPKTPQQPQPQAAPVSINAPAQAGTDAFGIASGSGAGIGAPSSAGTCLGTRCGVASGGGAGVSESFYRRYLSSALQERVQGDERISRLVFSADFFLTVSRDGRVTGVQFQGARGQGGDDLQKKLTEILSSVRGLDPPPDAMRFPQKITVRGRRAL